MHLAVGARLGPYEVVSLLGQGGMGEVYRARDTQLNRSVAIKILPELFAADAERVARFTREAQALAALNHPNIAQIYGLEGNGSPGSPRALVMELIEGEDLSGIAVNPFTAGVITSVSKTGALAYVSTASENTIAVWYGSDGARLGTLALPRGHYDTASISPDGAYSIVARSVSPSESSLWLVDLARGSIAPFSTGPARNDTAVWSPDSRRVVFAADRDGAQDLFVKTIGSSEPERPLYRSDVQFKAPYGWSPDGRWIIVSQLEKETSENVWLIPASGADKPRLVVGGPYRDRGGAPSPDGRWLAYTSDQTGRLEVYVQPLAESGARQQVSQQGAATAWWTRDGRQLIFVDGNWRTLWRVDVSADGSSFHARTPKMITTLPDGIIHLDASPDRQRFLAIQTERPGPGSVTVVQNWQAELQRLVR